MSTRKLSKADLETLAEFRYRLRRFLRFSEQVTRRHGVTPLQYQLMLQIKGFPGRDWAGVAELAERLQAKHHGVVALLSRCETAGLVRRGTSPADRRRVEVRLTPAGDRCLERLARLHRDELLSVAGAMPAFADPARARSASPRAAPSPAEAAPVAASGPAATFARPGRRGPGKADAGGGEVRASAEVALSVDLLRGLAIRS